MFVFPLKLPPFAAPATWKRCAAVAVGALVLLAAPAFAGPPFVTDDPEPVEYQHWEVYLASMTQHAAGNIAGTLPHVEVNYGVAPNLQLHVIVPDAFDSSGEASRQYGLGDTELGLKYRMAGESAASPEIGIFPLVEVPTGNAARGLGSGHTQLFLPVWLQKSAGSWTAYGGEGYWIAPGRGNENSWFSGLLVQNQVSKTFAPGLEVYYRTAQTRGGPATAQVNAGFTWDLTENYHILASAGPAIRGPRGYQTYLAFQWTFGPEEKAAGEK
jgi:hypothetical protein